MANRFYVEGRNEFNFSSFWWSAIYSSFKTQLNNPLSTRISYFPAYLNSLGLWTDPKVTFQLPTTTPTYIWPINNVTIYVADPTDGGLRWELISWQDLR